MNKPTVITALFALGVYILSAAISYTIFSKNGTFSQQKVSAPASVVPKQSGSRISFDQGPKTENCPLNGALYSKKQREWWEKHRPLGVMIENHEDARPQSGVSFADVVYEAVAEGSITRFLAVFYCQDAGFIGPVRSARTYFIDFISEYGDSPLYAHVGGANTEGPANALGQIDDYGWRGYNDLSEFSIGCPVYCRDITRLGHETATEHTMYSQASKLWDFAAKSRNLTNVDKKGNSWDTKFVPYTFKDEALLSDRAQSQSVHLEMWEGYKAYFIDWVYDRANNVYKRTSGGAPHIDKNTNKQLTTKNIIVLYMQESHANDGYENNQHLLYKTKGTGKAVVFMDGKKILARWKKDSRTARTQLLDANGALIAFNRGALWFEILPTTGVLTEK